MSRSGYHHGDLPRALLEAARRVVARDGAARASLRAIAGEAGVSPAAPYHHFDDRDALLAAVSASGFDSLREAMESAALGSERPGPLGRLQSAGVAYVRFAVDNPEIYRLMFSGVLQDRGRFPALGAAAEEAFGLLEGLLGGGVDGNANPKRENPAGDANRGRDEGDALPAVALATWSTVHGLAFLLIEELLGPEAEGLTPEEITRRVTLVLGRGLRSFMGDVGSRKG